MIVMLTVVSSPIGGHPTEDTKFMETNHVMSDKGFGETYDVMELVSDQRRTGRHNAYLGYTRAKKCYEYIKGMIKVEIGICTYYAKEEHFKLLAQSLYKSNKGSMSCIDLATLLSLLKSIEEMFQDATVEGGFYTWLEENR
jgi:hypothetical protein